MEEIIVSSRRWMSLPRAFDLGRQKERHGVFSATGIHAVGIVSAVAASPDMSADSRRLIRSRAKGILSGPTQSLARS